jgi:hypothetical protein
MSSVAGPSVPVGALDLLVVHMADRWQRPPVAGEPAGVLVHLGHQGAGRVERVRSACVRVLPHLRCEVVDGCRPACTGTRTPWLGRRDLLTATHPTPFRAMTFASERLACVAEQGIHAGR